LAPLATALMAVALAQQAPPAQPAPPLPALPGAARGDESQPDELFAGAWRDVADDDHWLLLEAGRLREMEHGHVTFARADYDVDHLVRSDWGRLQRWELTVEGEPPLLLVTSPARTMKLRRAEGSNVPAALDPKPLPLGEAAPLPAEQVTELQRELAQRGERDQAVRTGFTGQPDPAQLEEMVRVDHDNTAWLSQRIAAVGWIDGSRFGAEAASAAFLIVQHSGELPLMMAALPAIERDVRDHGSDGQHYALLWDRLQVNLGRKQRYGSQLGIDEQGRYLVVAIEERDEVDARRKELRMTPLKNYLDLFRNGPPPREVVFEDDLAR
jgi:hypothetical protein